jgi:hypothetical protein
MVGSKAVKIFMALNKNYKIAFQKTIHHWEIKLICYTLLYIGPMLYIGNCSDTM